MVAGADGREWLRVDTLTAKVVGVRGDGRIACSGVRACGRSGKDAPAELARQVLETVGLSRSGVIGSVVTGYGRITYEGADLQVSEITCHA